MTTIRYEVRVAPSGGGSDEVVVHVEAAEEAEAVTVAAMWLDDRGITSWDLRSCRPVKP